MAASPNDNAAGPVGVTIKADGKALADTVEVLSVDIRREAGRIPECRLVFADGAPADQDFPLTDAPTLAPGAKLSVAAFYGGNAAEVIFEGRVTAQRLRIDQRGSRLEVTARAEAVKLAQVRRTAVFTEQTDGDVIAKIAGDNGLSATVDSVGTATRDQVQNDCTDWDFLRLLADRNGLVLVAEGAKLQAARLDPGKAPVLTVTFGTDILSFDGEVSAAPAIAGAKGCAWDPATQQVVAGSGSPATAGSWGNTTLKTLADVLGSGEITMAAPAPFASADLSAYAGARLALAEWAHITGRCRFTGSAKVAPGTVLEIKGLSERFSGKGIITGVTHRIEAGSWTTEAILGLPAEWRTDTGTLEAPAAAGLASPARGVHVGKVVQLADDPDGAERVKVSLPALASDGVALWARLAAPYAGDGRGLMFLPEIDDEVLVAFLADDPSFPVVLGALHSGKFKRPATVDDTNATKIIKTASNLSVTFDDDKKVLTLATPGGASVALDDDGKILKLACQNGNAIELSSSGIKIDTPKDLTLSATGKIDIAATGDATLKGMNVTASGTTGFTGKGGATGEVSAGGTLTVKGALVQIN